VISAARNSRLIVASEIIAVVLAVIAFVSACAVHPQRYAAEPAQRKPPAKPVTSTPGRTTAPVGISGSYQVGERQVTFVEPAHIGPTGQHLGQRTLVTVIWYPRALRSAGPQPARGPFPLLVFAPGFLQCGDQYSHLLQVWAGAGYMVAAVNFPLTDCHVGAAAYEPDLVNQPGDMSYVVSRLLALSAQPHNPFSGLLNAHEIAAVGHSDGGDTVAALAANACCTDHRLAATAVLSGAEWPPMPGRYFPHGAPPMLFVQGSADTINPPWTSLQLYRADGANAKYYLDLLGASHMTPYVGSNPVERLVARVTLAFFDRYVLGQARALATMTQDGNVSGIAALVNGDRLPPP
jgi:predicted dienelactone hydrolase